MNNKNNHQNNDTLLDDFLSDDNSDEQYDTATSNSNTTNVPVKPELPLSDTDAYNNQTQIDTKIEYVSNGIDGKSTLLHDTKLHRHINTVQQLIDTHTSNTTLTDELYEFILQCNTYINEVDIENNNLYKYITLIYNKHYSELASQTTNPTIHGRSDHITVNPPLTISTAK